MKKSGIILVLGSIVLFGINYGIFWTKSPLVTAPGWVVFSEIISNYVCPLLLTAGLILLIVGLIIKK